MALVTGVAVGLVSAPTALGALQPVQIDNNCDAHMDVALRYRRGSVWRTAGWWHFRPGERAVLKRVWSDNSVAYFWARSRDGEHAWRGSPDSRADRSYEIGGEKLRFRRFEFVGSRVTKRLGVKCGEARPSRQVRKSKSCRPLAVAFGGLSDKGNKTMRRFADRRARQLGVDREYFYHDEARFAVEAVASHLDEFPSSPVVLAGHSWGGSAAYVAARALSTRVSMLVTLDAVGGIAYPDTLASEAARVAAGLVFPPAALLPNYDEFKVHLERPPGLQHWINVRGERPGFTMCVLTLGGLLLGMPTERQIPNCIADAGGLWGYQEQAFNVSFRGDHIAVEKMYDLIEKDVESSLLCEKGTYGESRWRRE